MDGGVRPTLKHYFEIAAITTMVVAEEHAKLGVGNVRMYRQRVKVICEVEACN